MTKMAKIALIKNGSVVNTIISDVGLAESLPGYDAAIDISEIPDIGIGWGYSDGVFAAPAPRPEPIPASVTMRQARLALLNHNLLANVQPAINALSEPNKTKAQIEWEYSNALERDNPFIATLGVALGLNAAAIDALFVEAATL